MQNGTVGFLDFGIVGRVSPVTWKAVEALLGAVAKDDYRTMAKVEFELKRHTQSGVAESFNSAFTLLQCEYCMQL
jgi:predicted unusual protein kinase regulating ubiquinone biosynthesis (AarF/ABC1/UbiB family)